jgi:hypothetical protein
MRLCLVRREAGSRIYFIPEEQKCLGKQQIEHLFVVSLRIYDRQ